MGDGVGTLPASGGPGFAGQAVQQPLNHAPAMQATSVLPPSTAPASPFQFGGAPLFKIAGNEAVEAPPINAPSGLSPFSQAGSPPTNLPLTVGDVMGQLPPDMVRAGALPPEQPITLPPVLLENALRSGQAAVPAFEIYRVCPALFQVPVSPQDPRTVSLPAAKLPGLIATARSGGQNANPGGAIPAAPAPAANPAPASPFTVPAAAPSAAPSPFAAANPAPASQFTVPAAAPSPFAAANPASASPFAALSPAAATPSPFAAAAPAPAPATAPAAPTFTAPQAASPFAAFTPAPAPAPAAAPASPFSPFAAAAAPAAGASPFAAAAAPAAPQNQAPESPPTLGLLPLGTPPLSPFAAAPAPAAEPVAQAAPVMPSITPAASSPFGQATPAIPGITGLLIPGNKPLGGSPPPMVSPGKVKLSLANILRGYSVEEIGFDSSSVPGWVNTQVDQGVLNEQIASGTFLLPLGNLIDGVSDLGFRNMLGAAKRDFQVKLPSNEVFHALTGASEAAPAPAAAAPSPFAAANPAPMMPGAPAAGKMMTIMPGGAAPSPFAAAAPAEPAPAPAAYMLAAPAPAPAAPPAAPISFTPFAAFNGGPMNTEPLHAAAPPAPAPAPAAPAPQPMFFTPPAAPEPPKENPFIPAAVPAPVPAPASPFGAAFPPAPEAPKPPAQQPSVPLAATLQPMAAAISAFSTPAPAAAPVTKPFDPFAPAAAPAPATTGGFSSAQLLGQQAGPLGSSPTRPASATQPLIDPFAAAAKPAPQPEKPAETPVPLFSAPQASAFIPAAAPAPAPVEPAPAPTPLFKPAAPPEASLPPEPLPAVMEPSAPFLNPMAGGDFLSPKPAPEPKVAPKPAPAPTPAPAAPASKASSRHSFLGLEKLDTDTDQLLLRALLGTEETLTASKVVELLASQPGLSACVCLNGSSILSHCDASAPEAAAFQQQAGDIAKQLRTLAPLIGIEGAETFTMNAGGRLITFCFPGSVTVGVLHQSEPSTGLRDKITLVARELARMLG